MSKKNDKKPLHQPTVYVLPEDRYAALEKKAAAYEEACKPIVHRLNEIGIPVRAINETLQLYVPLPLQAIDVLLTSLPTLTNWDVLEWVARYIGTAKKPYDGRPLADAFDRCPDFNAKWAIGDAISRSKPRHIDSWLFETLKNPVHGQARQMLCSAAPRLLSAELANEALMTCFDDVPGHAALALRQTGGQRELDFLRRKQGDWTSWQAKCVRKAIEGIEIRLAKEGKHQG